MDMDQYVRKQAILSGLHLNLKDLYRERDDILNTLKMLDKMIEKHENYLELLEADEEE